MGEWGKLAYGCSVPSSRQRQGEDEELDKEEEHSGE